MPGTLPTQALLSWNDIAKLVVGFAISLFLIWAKSAGERMYRRRTLRRSAWNVAKHHTDFRRWLDDLDATVMHERNGGVWLSSVDLSEHYAAMIAELSQLDPKNSDAYIGYLSAEQVVRNGFDRLEALRLDFIRARSTSPAAANDAVSIRRSLIGQCAAIRTDLKIMAERELEVLELIQVKHADAIDPVLKLKGAISELTASLRPPGT